MLRKYESGAPKRRLKKEREEMVAKLPKMTNFFSSNQTNMQFPLTVNNNKNNERKDENNNTENEEACQGLQMKFMKLKVLNLQCIIMSLTQVLQFLLFLMTPLTSTKQTIYFLGS